VKCKIELGGASFPNLPTLEGVVRSAHFHCKQMTLKVVMCQLEGDTLKKRLIVYAEECCEHNTAEKGRKKEQLQDMEEGGWANLHGGKIPPKNLLVIAMFTFSPRRNTMRILPSSCHGVESMHKVCFSSLSSYNGCAKTEPHQPKYNTPIIASFSHRTTVLKSEYDTLDRLPLCKKGRRMGGRERERKKGPFIPLQYPVS
jgi:hypothetical protein